MTSKAKPASAKTVSVPESGITPTKKEENKEFQTVFRELGYYITRKEQYERALKAFDEAIKMTPTDKRALMGRSIARAKAVQYQGALEDINKALNLDENDLVVLAHKALNTYLNCEFEDALVQNLRRVPVRKKPESFVMGVMHCTEAIENCVGERAGRPLRDHYKIIRKLAWKKAREEKKPYEPKDKAKKKKQRKRLMMRNQNKQLEPVAPLKMKHLKPVEIPKDDDEITMNPHNLEASIRDSLYSHKSEDDAIPPGEPYPYRPQQRYTTNIENFMAEKYLEKLYLDKQFLKELKFNPGVGSPNKPGSKKIIKLAKEGYKTLNYKQELLRTRRPFYFIKCMESNLSSRLKMRQEEEIKKMQVAYQKDAEVLLNIIQCLVKDKQHKKAIDYCAKLLVYCNKVQKKFLPKREIYLKEMYKITGKIFVDLKRLSAEKHNWYHFRRIRHQLGVSAEVPSTDSLLRDFKNVVVDYKKQITIAEDRLRKATSSEELAWIYHELSRFHIEVKRLDLARVYARKCIQEGYRKSNFEWVVNGQFLVVKVNILQHNRNDAKIEVNEAIKVAKKIPESQDLIEYLQKTLEVIDNIDFDDVHGVKVVEKREQLIINLMKEAGMKEETAHLFRQMAVMPASRRMSVMPGVKFDHKIGKTSKRKASILGIKKEESHSDVANHDDRPGVRNYLEV